MSDAAGIPSSNITPIKIDIPEGGNNGMPPKKLEREGGIDTIDPNGKSAWTELSEVAQTIYDFVVNSLSNLTNWFYYGLSCVSNFFFPGISFEKKSEELRLKFNAGGTFEKIQVLSEVATLQYDKVKLEELFQQFFGLLDQKVKDSLVNFYHDQHSEIAWVMPKGGWQLYLS